MKINYGVHTYIMSLSQALSDLSKDGRLMHADIVAAVEQCRQEAVKLEQALQSIASNTCCDKCQEAALVAQEALNRHPPSKNKTLRDSIKESVGSDCRHFDTKIE
jgi:predicted secreted Zn-dependent protease